MRNDTVSITFTESELGTLRAALSTYGNACYDDAANEPSVEQRRTLNAMADGAWNLRLDLRNRIR